MFAIASYITPLLMGYLDKYVELRQEDFKINFWEGDATLKTVKLRTDFFEKLLQIPVIFKSGQIKELKIYVPWHKINSEPIVITLKTVECVLKVRDTAYDDHSSSHSSEQVKKQLQAAKAKQKLKRQDSEVLPPGYMQGMISRILNNITLVIDNLVIKFVEDDIVLSVNVMSAECYPVDINWNRAFVDFNPPEFTSRKVLKFCDLTVCMDRADASGNIKSYEQPLLFKCIVACRILMTYDSLNAKLPKLTRFNLFCEELKATISDNQLPIFIRLIELCIALYYGVIHIPVSEKKLEPDKQEVTRSSADETNQAGNEVNAYGQGWGVNGRGRL
ncbi:intermembrane lipid transfer protein VPS13B-like isoform X2 [Patella vulgata]|uniref:intermembrane lipid transfer protein VPS13B-like isoform X2 n=1 Tax=Patella vulgata TaxID=6465 RepID=UPI0024A95D60|nr:intermembrane lipid transfer protein VPS13B-like isoform X2 [Patella vulgata]